MKCVVKFRKRSGESFEKTFEAKTKTGIHIQMIEVWQDKPGEHWPIKITEVEDK